MFNLQQKYKKTFHKMQNQETSSLETPLRYQGRNVRGTARNRKVICADHTERKGPALPGPQALSLKPAALAPLSTWPRCSIWSRQIDDLQLMDASPLLCRLKVILCQGLKTGFLVFIVTTLLFLQIQNILAQFNYKH